jgi:hypothetical protein
VADYLADFIRAERPRSIAPWVSTAVYERATEAARSVGTGPCALSESLRPIDFPAPFPRKDTVPNVLRHERRPASAAPFRTNGGLFGAQAR